MSTVGILSFGYQRATDYNNQLKERVEAVGRQPNNPVARIHLSKQLAGLAAMLEPLAEDTRIPLEQSLSVPVPMLKRLRKTSLDGKRLPVAMKETAERLKGSDALTAADEKLFEVVLDAAAYEASDAFDRVLRR
jgi:hypothetical protein